MTKKLKVGFTCDEKALHSLDDCDVSIIGFDVFKSICFKNELSGKSSVLVEIGRLSGQKRSVVLAGVETDNYGVKRTSIVASESSKIIGISDETRVEKRRSAGFGYKIYKTKCGQIGVLVGNDLFSPNAVKTLVDCGCELIVAITPLFNDFKAEVLVQALAYLNGVAICFLFGNQLLAYSPRGELEFSGVDSGKFKLSTGAEYSEYIYKTRGEPKSLFREKKSNAQGIDKEE